MKRLTLLLCLLALAAHRASADDSWPRAWTVNVSGHWKITGCLQEPETPRELDVQQTEHHLAQAQQTGSPIVLNGSVHGHDVSFSISNARALNCLPHAATLRFDGVANGARIVGTLRAADDANQRAAVTIRLHREFMLSFDDGPLPGKTDRVLDMLRQLRAGDGTPVRAAFFTVGEAPTGFWTGRAYYAPYEIWSHKGSTRAYPALVARILADGHMLGNHTAHHAWFRWPRFGDKDPVVQELRQWETVTSRGPQQEKLFRPPYLITTDAVQAAGNQAGYQLVLGETVGDAAPGSNVDAIEWKVSKILETRDGSSPALLIFHDILPVTYIHLQEIVDHLMRQGYTLVHFDPRRLDARTLIRPH